MTVRVNLVPNSSFEVDTAMWQAQGTGTTLARDTTVTEGDTASGKLTLGTVTGEALRTTILPDPVTAGERYGARARLRISSAVPVYIAIRFLAADGATTTAYVTGTATTPAANTWVTLSVAGTAPAGSAFARVYVYRTSTGAGQSLWVNKVLMRHLEAAELFDPDEYWDGATVDTADATYSWRDTPNASPSISDAWLPTYPWSADTPDLLTESLTHLAGARVVLPSGEVIELELEGGTLSWDETRSPRAMADLTCRVPEDAALLSRIDPRTGARLVVDVGYLRPGDVEDLQTAANLALQSRPVRRPDDRMTLTGYSDEVLVTDNAASASLTLNTTTTAEAMTYIIGLTVPAPPINVTAPVGPAVSQTQPDADKWDTLADLADRIGARVYDDGLRQWWIAPVPVIGKPAHALAVGVDGTILESEAGLSREGWFNRVYLKYKWTDASDVDHVIRSVRSVNTGTYAAVLGNTSTYFEERELPATQAQADAAATALVARTVTRGRTFSVTAISAYWLRPGHTATVTLPTGDPEDHLVASVAFDLATGRMNVTTRLPDNTGTIGA